MRAAPRRGFFRRQREIRGARCAICPQLNSISVPQNTSPIFMVPHFLPMSTGLRCVFRDENLPEGGRASSHGFLLRFPRPGLAIF